MIFKSFLSPLPFILIAQLLLSCSGKRDESSSDSKPQSDLQIDGYWFSEGNIHVESNWIKFDLENLKFHEWSSEISEPQSPSGQFSFENGNIVLTYYKSQHTKLLLIDQLDEQTIRLSEKGPNNGVLTYMKIKIQD